MSIQWYPGHMTKAVKKAEEAMEFNDVVIEVLDARIPGSSINPLIGSLSQQVKEDLVIGFLMQTTGIFPGLGFGGFPYLFGELKIQKKQL